MLTEDFRNRPADPAMEPEPEDRVGSLTDKISDIVLTSFTPGWWWIGFALSFALLALFLYFIAILFGEGVGIWGINIPVVWGVAIINLVFWIGIGHAGTLISAILLLMRQEWRTSLSRFAEAMTLFALAVAGLFPILHLGRPWLAVWIAPYPDTLQLNPQWRSPLVWDAFAITTYVVVSALFWFVGLLPDLAAMRDKAKRRFVKTIYSALSMGWRGDAAHWERYNTATFLLAALATPLVISVHSIVAMDFAVSLVVGWHHTIFPPYFVAGAVFSGLAMVLVIAIPLRSALKLQDLITIDHINNAGKLMLVTGLLVAYGYAMEIFAPWYTGHEEEWFVVVSRAIGPYAPYFWLMILCNVVAAQLFWFRQVRTNLNVMFGLSLVVLVGMWLERFVIIAISLFDARLPSMRNLFIPATWDWITVIAPFGLFLTLMYLFIRLLPLIPMFETQELLKEGTLHGRDVEVDEAPAGD